MTDSLLPFSDEVTIPDLLHGYTWSKIRIFVAMHGSRNLIESTPCEMNNFLVIPGDGFWCQKVNQFYNSLDNHW